MSEKIQAPGPFETWAVVELLGHRQMAGLVRETTLAGVAMLQVDAITHDGQLATQYYPPSSLYCLTPVTEETARAVVERREVCPAGRWEALAQSPKPAATMEDCPW